MWNPILRFFAGSASILILSCAQPVSPTGGERDTKAPRILSVTPADSSTNIRPAKIVFHFDENIQVKSPENNVVISPIIGVKPVFEKTNRTFSIVFHSDSFNSNTTYSISFNEAISDLNEGNPLKNYSYYFSTASSLDTLSLLGDAKYSVAPKKTNLKIFCTDALTGNIYTAKFLNSSFQIRGLNTNKKNVLIFNDENNNLITDPQEDIGVLNGAIAGPDSVSIHMYSRKKQSVFTYKNAKYFYIHGVPNSIIDTMKFRNDISIEKDTIFSDSLTISRIKSGLDNNYFIISDIIEKASEKIIYSLQYNYDLNQVELQFNKRFAEKNHISITSQNKKTLVPNTFKKNEIYIPIDSSDVWVMPAKSIEMEDGSLNSDSITIHVTKQKIADIFIKNNKNYSIICELKNSKNAFAFTIPANGKLKKTVPQGTYELYYFEDLDGNHLLTPPLLIEGKYREGELWNIKSTVQAQPNLENEIIIN